MTARAAGLVISASFVVMAAVHLEARVQDAAPPARVAEERQAMQLLNTGRHQEALVSIKAAAAAYARRKDVAGQGRVELLRSTVLRALGQLDASVAAGRRARDLAAAAGDRRTQVEAILRLASIAVDRGQLDETARLLQTAVPLAQEGSARELLPALFEELGSHARRAGRTAEALQYQTSAVEAADTSGLPGPRVRTRGARSTTYLQAGRYDEALADAQVAHEIAFAGNDRSFQAVAAFGLAQVHGHLWSLDRAAELWTEAVEAYRAIGLKIGVAVALKQRNETLFAMGELDRAAADGRAALQALEEAGTRAYHPELLARLALIEARRGDQAAARGFERRALALASAPETPPLRLRFLYNDLGLVAHVLGDEEVAIERFDRTLRISQQLMDPEYEWRARHNIGRAALSLGRVAQARAELERAVAVLERMRRGLPDAALRAAFLSDRTAAYQTLVSALQRGDGETQPEVERALEVAERARGRSLADLLVESQARAADPRIEATVAEDRRFSARLTTLQKSILGAPDDAARTALVAELRTAERDYEAHMVRVRRENPAYASLIHPQPLAAAGIAALAGDRQAIVEFLFTEGGGFAWTIRGGHIRSHAIPSARTIASQVRLLNALAAGDDVEGLERVGAHLYDALLGPAASSLEGVRRLILVPSGPLQRLSFALLRTPSGRWLGEAYALSHVPSATVLAELHERGADADARELLAFSAPPPANAAGKVALFGASRRSEAVLEQADDEVRDIARLLGARADIRSGQEALESAIKNAELSRYGVIHFATHTLVDEVIPRRSAILLGSDAEQDGLLQLNEIPHLRLDAALVVLASCSSHLGREVRGEGLSSLSRAFMHAGARAVLASLWEVDDAQTRRFMGLFYRALRNGAAPDEALQRAASAMIRAGGDAARPENWAAFVLAGDARHPVVAPQEPPLLRAGLVFAAVAAALASMLWISRRGGRRPADAPPAPVGR